MSNNIAQTRICVEKIHNHKNEYAKLKEMSNSQHHFDKLRAAFITKKIWPKDSKIRIAFIGEPNSISRTSLNAIQDTVKSKNLKLDPLQISVNDMPIKEAIKKIVNERFVPLVGLDIKFVEDINLANVRISFDPDGGAWSLVGTDCLTEKAGNPTMNLGWFDVATTIHEFGHCMGLIHEHQNPSGNKINWNEDKVLRWARTTQGWDNKTTETNIIDRYSSDQINGSTYDPLSIMLYFFPGDLTLDNKGTQQNLRLSGVDVKYLSNIYPNQSNSPEEFYKKAYNESLENAIKESDNTEDGGGEVMNKKLWIGITIIVIIIILLGFLISFFSKTPTKKSNNRYTS